MAEVLLDGDGFVDRAGGEGPGPEEGPQDAVVEGERRVGQGISGVLYGGAGQRYTRRPTGVALLVPATWATGAARTVAVLRVVRFLERFLPVGPLHSALP
ncbi:hypothetical protein GCM10010449_35170 [Streptomyces rectiviolaceus]|uniref:Uncharacterized protein n=1 Tax=Streptomyces rectiviolaceus TaxID=332591 RepID=A0ABP6MFI0_9ACTN